MVAFILVCAYQITVDRDVLDQLPKNTAARFAENGDKTELILSPLDAIEEIALRQWMDDMLPRVDVPELILEIDARTHFIGAFTHLSEQSSHVSNLNISICAMLMAEPETPVQNPLYVTKNGLCCLGA